LLCTLLKRKFSTIRISEPLYKKEDVMKASASKLSRRNFLLAVGAGGVATAAVVAGKKPEAQPKKAEAVKGSRGYQLTEHVRKYYETTKV